MKGVLLLAIGLLVQTGSSISAQSVSSPSITSANWQKAVVKNSAGVQRALLFGQATFSTKTSTSILFVDCSEDGTIGVSLRIKDSVGFDTGDFDGEDAIGSRGKLLSYSIGTAAPILHSVQGGSHTSNTFDFSFVPSKPELSELASSEAAGKQVTFTIRSPAKGASLTAYFRLPESAAILQEVSAPFLRGKSQATVAAAQGEMNITGISLGMSLNAVKEKLGSSYHEATSFTRKYPAGPYVLCVIKDTKADAYTLEFAGDKLVYIEHDNNFPDNAELSTAQTITDLKAKFGPSGRENVLGGNAFGNIDWVYNTSGQQVFRPNCTVGSSNNIGLQDFSGHYFSAAQFPLPHRTDCFRSVAAVFYFKDAQGKLLKSLVLRLQDDAALTLNRSTA